MPIKHHTKNKGDLGVISVIKDLAERGFYSALPMSEHMPFDVIAIDSLANLKRIQVKYIKPKNGKIDLDLSSHHSDSNDSHRCYIDLSKIDGFAIYNPDDKETYYIPVKNIKNKSGFTLRLTKPNNNQIKKINFAKDFIDPNRIFGS